MGELIEDVDGALWSQAALERCRVEAPGTLTRVVVAVDPPASGSEASDACGIIVAGAIVNGPPRSWRAWVLEDASVSAASPNAWAEAAVDAAERHGADRIVAEVNMGGDMVEAVIRQQAALVPFRAVRATRDKRTRAEPVAALYEQGRVQHVRGLGALEDQMCQMTARGYRGRGSPDRVDALVWAMFDLMVEPAARWRNPQVRLL
jgi:phage terminase large subunit-like protein